MNTIIEFINANLSDIDPFTRAIALGIIFMIIYDFYHLLFASVTSWFKK